MGKMREKGGVGREGELGGDRERNRQVNGHAFVRTTLEQTTIRNRKITGRKECFRNYLTWLERKDHLFFRMALQF